MPARGDGTRGNDDKLPTLPLKLGHLGDQARHYVWIQAVAATGNQTGAKLDHYALIELITNLTHSANLI